MKQTNPGSDQVETHRRCSLPAASIHLKLKPPPGGRDHRQAGDISTAAPSCCLVSPVTVGSLLVCWEPPIIIVVLQLLGQSPPVELYTNTNAANAHARHPPVTASPLPVPVPLPLRPPSTAATAQPFTQLSTVSQTSNNYSIRNHEAKVFLQPGARCKLAFAFARC